VGENVENLLWLLLARAPTPELAHTGLLFLDGLHHIARRAPSEGSRRDISGGEVQRELVRLLDGLPSQVQRDGGLRHPQAPSEAFPCDRLMIAAAVTVDPGPAASSDRALRDALIGQGLDDELLSRFDVIVRVGRLDAMELAEVLTHPEAGVAAPTRALIETLGGRLTIMPDGAEALAASAAADPDGAWALLRPLSRLAERALEAEPRSWILDRDLARALSDA
jgi:ATP-dependent protease Clp ATPase subunit